MSGERTLTWGRAWDVDWISLAGCALFILCTPFLVLFFRLACNQYGGSLVAPFRIFGLASSRCIAFGSSCLQ